MRKSLVFSFLLALAVVLTGCSSSSDRGGAANSNATGTTTYSNSSAPTTAAPAAHPDMAPSPGGNPVGGAAPKSSPNKPGIKPPTE